MQNEKQKPQLPTVDVVNDTNKRATQFLMNDKSLVVTKEQTDNKSQASQASTTTTN